MVRRSLLTVVAFAGLGGAQAAEFRHISTSGYAAIALSGPIQRGDADRFRRTLAAVRDSEPGRPLLLLLQSPGGLIVEGTEIGLEARRNGVATAAMGPCASACALAWLGGASLWITPGSAIGFHASRTPEGENAPMGDALVGHYVATLGFGPVVSMYATSVPHSAIRWLTPQDARQMGLQVSILQGDASRIAAAPSQPAPTATALAAAPARSARAAQAMR